jgi:hypothetical protein
MSSPAQITANRANAQYSTGPRSVEGKAASSRNAFRFGVHSEAIIIPGEDPAELEQLQQQYEIELDPHGPVECALFQMIVRADWLLRRLSRIEAEVIRTRMAAVENPGENSLGDVYAQDAVAFKLLMSIDRRQQALYRQYFGALKQLQEIHAARSQSDIYRAMLGQPTVQSDLPTETGVAGRAQARLRNEANLPVPLPQPNAAAQPSGHPPAEHRAALPPSRPPFENLALRL